MPSFRRRSPLTDDAPAHQLSADRQVDRELARALAEEAEAEADEAEALAVAARARARALRLRREAERGAGAEPAPPAAPVNGTPTNGTPLETTTPVAAPERPAETAGDTVPTDHVESVAAIEDTSIEDAAVTEDAEIPEDAAEPRRRRQLPRPRWTAVAATLVVVAILALLGLSGFFVWQHRQADQVRQQRAEYAAAGRQNVVTLMSLDFARAQDDVQRIIDNSTGQFKNDFASQAEDFVKVAQDSKVVTEVTVNSTAVEQMDADTAVVLVAASSRVTNSAGAKQEPRTWRLSVNLQREGDQIKMSKVEFVP